MTSRKSRWCCFSRGSYSPKSYTALTPPVFGAVDIGQRTRQPTSRRKMWDCIDANSSSTSVPTPVEIEVQMQNPAQIAQIHCWQHRFCNIFGTRLYDSHPRSNVHLKPRLNEYSHSLLTMWNAISCGEKGTVTVNVVNRKQATQEVNRTSYGGPALKRICTMSGLPSTGCRLYDGVQFRSIKSG